MADKREKGSPGTSPGRSGGKLHHFFTWACLSSLDRVNLARPFMFYKAKNLFIRGPPDVFHFKKYEMEGRRMPEWIKIKISDFYQNAAGEQEYTYVSPEVYEALANEFRKEADAQRKRDERNRASMNYEDGETDDLLFAQQESLEEQVLRELELQTLQSAMRTLTEVQRERLQFYFFEGMTYREIAEKLQISDYSVRESITGAIKKIKKYFD